MGSIFEEMALGDISLHMSKKKFRVIWCIAGHLEGHRGATTVEKISKPKVLTFANMLSKFQAKRIIAKVTVSDIFHRFSPL